MRTKIKKVFKYFSHTLEGPDGKLSGKRLLGSILIICGVHIGWYVISQRPDHIADGTILVGAFFGAGISFWGITSWTTMQEMKLNTTTDSSQMIRTTPNTKEVTDSSSISTAKTEEAKLNLD